MDNTELIRHIKGGDRKAFDAFCSDHYAMCVSYARAFIPGEWAEDIVQDVFLSVWQNRTGIDENKSINGYLLRSVYNRCLNYIRRCELSGDFRDWNRMRIMSLSLQSADPYANSTLRKLYSRELGEVIAEAVEALPPRCREIFRLSYIEELSNKEIAEKLGISVSTVENQMSTALKRLRKSLSSEQYLFIISLLAIMKNFS